MNHVVEEWRNIPGYEGLYEASSLGRIRSVDRSVKVRTEKEKNKKIKGIVLKTSLNRGGYLGTQLCKDGGIKRFSIQRIIANVFIPNPEDKPQVNHIDGNKTNNRADNLEWCTGSENMKHAIDNKLKEPITGDKHYSRKQGFVHRGTKKVQCITTGKIFNSIREASRYYKCDENKIGMVCNGKRNTCGKLDNKTKLEWRYL